MISKEQLSQRIQSAAVDEKLKQELLALVANAQTINGDTLFLLQQKIENSSEASIDAIEENMKKMALASFEADTAMLQQESEKLAAEIAKAADEIDLQDARAAIEKHG